MSRLCELVSNGTFASQDECNDYCSPRVELGCSGPYCLGAYYPNWAQYRDAPFTFQVDQLKGALHMYDYLVYSFGKFDPKTFVVSGTEEANGNVKDTVQIKAIQAAAFQLGKTNFKLLFSIGGWSFPAAYWSLALSTPSNRTTLINECVKYLKANNLQGIDIDWEFPGSQLTTKYVQKAHSCVSTGVTCTELGDAAIENPEAVEGVCVITDQGQLANTDDFANLGLFVEEMSVEFRKYSFMITIAAGASPDMIQRYDFSRMINAIDVWHVMAYDFWVSDTDNKEFSACTAPTAPLYSAFPQPKPVPVATSLPHAVRRRMQRRLDPSQTCTPTGFDQNLSVDNAVTMYLDRGVHRKSIALGLAFYGHTWYVPDLVGSEYAQFGIRSQIQENNCCGPLKNTYGGYGGTAAVLCGSLLYSEINLNRNNFQTTEDVGTQSTIGYWPETSGVLGVPKGTWISYNSPVSIAALTTYAKNKDLRGVFAWDISSDTVLPAAPGVSAPRWTFDLSTVVYNTLNNIVDPVCGLNYECPSATVCVNENGQPTCYCSNGVVYNEMTKCATVDPVLPKKVGICTKSENKATSCMACDTTAECGGDQCYLDVDPNCCPSSCSWQNGTCIASWNTDHSSVLGVACNCNTGWYGNDCSSTIPVPVPPVLSKKAGICTKSENKATSCMACDTTAECGGDQCYLDVDPNCCPASCSWQNGTQNGTCIANWNTDHSSVLGVACNCKTGWSGMDCSVKTVDPEPVPPPTTSCPVGCLNCYDIAGKTCMNTTEYECRGWMDTSTRYTWCG